MWQNNYRQALRGLFFFSFSFLIKCVVTDFCGRGWNTDDPTTSLKPPPFVPSHSSICRRLPPPLLCAHWTTAKSPAWRSRREGFQLLLRYLVSWLLDGLIFSPSLPAERIVLPLNALMVWNLRSSHRRVQAVSIYALCLRLFTASGNIFSPEVTHIVSGFFILGVLQIFCQESFGKDRRCLLTDGKKKQPAHSG